MTVPSSLQDLDWEAEAQAEELEELLGEGSESTRLRQSLAEIEDAFEQEMAVERHRRVQLRKRATNRARARQLQRTESRGRARFSVLAVALTLTVVVVVIVMFETLALIAGG